jgi:ribosomal protein S18 acetylase RimI-like enzyme
MPDASSTRDGAPAVERVAPADWPRLGPFVFRHNRTADGAVRCLHADQGDSEAAHVDELSSLKPDGAAFWQVRGDREPLGLIGCEFDATAGIAWIRGPWTDAGPLAADRAAALLRTLESALPQVHRFHAFPRQGDGPLDALYRGAGYRLVDVHRVMQVALGTLPPDVAADHRIARAGRADLPQWLPLHRQLFPATYLSDRDIEAALDDVTRLVLTARIDGRPAGYLVAKDEAAMDEVYIDYVGVDPAGRGQGVGRALLQEAMRWVRGLGRRHAALTVRQDREAALSLYRQCGFVELSAGAHWRKDR